MNFIFLLKILYLLLPAAFANMVPVFMKKMNFLNYPLDFKLKFFGNRLFGNNKTFRGLVFGIIGSIVVVLLQSFLYEYEFFLNINLVNYSLVNVFGFGFLVGFGVLFGDLVSSFIKRRFGFKSGEHFFILDQINGGLGFGFLIVLTYFKSWNLFLWVILIWFVGHLVIKYIGYLLGIYKEKI